MLQRIAAIVITVAGVILALVIGFWVLVVLGVVAVAGALVYFVRSRFMNSGPRAHDHDANVIEGEFTVVDDDKKDHDGS